MQEFSPIENEAEQIRSIGIALETNVSYGAYCLSDGTVRMVVNEDKKVPETEEEFGFEGFSSLLNAGVASSEIGLRIRKIRRAVEKISESPITSAVISLPMKVPGQTEIQTSMKEREKSMGRYPGRKLDLEIYRELELHDAGAWDIVKRAAEMAGIEKVLILPRAEAIACAYEHIRKENVLQEGETVVVYDWGKEDFSATLIQKYRGSLNILWQEIIKNPAIDTNDPVVERSTLSDCVQSSMRQEILKNGKMQAMGLDMAYKDAWDAFYATAENVIDQVKQGKRGKLIWDNGWAREEIDYPDRAFRMVFEPFYQRTEDLTRKVIYEPGFQETDISRIFLAGEWGNYPYIRERLKEFIGIRGEVCVMENAELAAVKGAAYVSRRYYE